MVANRGTSPTPSGQSALSNYSAMSNAENCTYAPVADRATWVRVIEKGSRRLNRGIMGLVDLRRKRVCEEVDQADAQGGDAAQGE